jgi:phytoene dehydrogenase-like protein
MPATLDKTYDGIIVGAGHHGLVLGSYLAKCGLDILLVDRRLQYGGALVTEEAPRPASITTCIRSITSTSARRRGSRI